MELVYTMDLKSIGVIHVGSTPTRSTNEVIMICDNCQKSVGPPMFQVKELSEKGYEHQICSNCARIASLMLGLILHIAKKSYDQGVQS